MRFIEHGSKENNKGQKKNNKTLSRRLRVNVFLPSGLAWWFQIWETSRHFGCIFPQTWRRYSRSSWFSPLLKQHKPPSQACWDKNKSICSSSSSQLSGQICQIAFVTLTVLAVRICHCAEVWFLADIMQRRVMVRGGWTGHAAATQLSLAEPSFPLSVRRMR